MKPTIRKWHKNWWTLRYFDARHLRPCSIFADTWNEAITLLAHGYREGYIKWS